MQTKPKEQKYSRDPDSQVGWSEALVSVFLKKNSPRDPDARQGLGIQFPLCTDEPTEAQRGHMEGW